MCIISLGTTLFPLHLLFSLQRDKGETGWWKAFQNPKSTELWAQPNRVLWKNEPAVQSRSPSLPLPSGSILKYQALEISPSYLLCRSVSWHRFSIEWISSRIRQPGLQKRQRSDVTSCNDPYPKKERCPGSLPSLLPTFSLPICSLTPWEL